MLRMGIVGAENSHCPSIARLMNVEKKVNCRVTTVWGETKKFARRAAERGEIPRIVQDWREMLGEVDGVMIDHRHPRYHAEVARFFVRNGVPCFVDKPFTYTLREAKDLCRLARRHSVPIVSFSAKPLQRSFKDFQKELRKIGDVHFYTSTGPVDIKSKYGGIFFYGIHQVEPIIELFGNQPDTALLRRHGDEGVATITYKDGPVVTINCVNAGVRPFHGSAVGEKGILDWTFQDKGHPYLPGARLFAKMFRDGKEPFDHERLIAPVAVLEALDKSLKLKKPVKVGKVSLS